MTYADGRIVYDADSHVMETREWLDPFMDADLKKKLRPLYSRDTGRIEKLLEQAKARKADKAAEAAAFENPIAGPKAWLAAGAFDPAERSRVLDLFGFSAQLVFGTFSLAPALEVTDEGVKYAAVRARNEAMAAFCRTDKRLFGVRLCAARQSEAGARRDRCRASDWEPRDHGFSRTRGRAFPRAPGSGRGVEPPERGGHTVHLAHRAGQPEPAGRLPQQWQAARARFAWRRRESAVSRKSA